MASTEVRRVVKLTIENEDGEIEFKFDDTYSSFLFGRKTTREERAVDDARDAVAAFDAWIHNRSKHCDTQS